MHSAEDSTGHTTSFDGILAGGGAIGEIARSFDWSRTALGSVDAWPQSLKTSVSTCLNSRFAIVLWWGKELVTVYNDAYRAIIGIKHPAAFGAPARELWPEIWHIIGPMLQGVMERGEATWADNLLLELERNGYPEECYFTFSYSPIRDETGGVGGVFTPVQETTRQVIGERRLRTLRDLGEVARAANAQSSEEVCKLACRTLADNLYDIPFAAFYLFSQDGSVAHLSCSTAGPAGGNLLPEAVRMHDAAAGWPFAAAAQSGEAEYVELSAGLHDVPRGAWPVPPQNVLVAPISPGGQRVGFALFAINPRKRVDEEYQGFLSLIASHVTTAIAEARAWEEERKRARALAELDQAKTAFFSNVSHEFRTPLTLMLGPLEEILSTKGALPPSISDLATVIQRNGLRMQKLVNTLLDFSRLEAGRMKASFEPADLGSLTAELAAAFRSAIEKAGLKLNVECPPLGQPIYVDRQMWEKVVFNLLSNAFKYTFEGAISVRLEAREQGAVLTVEDSGSGIPESELPHIFERFHRVEGSRGRSQEGTGIGLALVSELVKLHGGTIAVRSNLGQGTSFIVCLPFGTAHLPREQMRSAQSAGVAAPAGVSYVEEALRWLPREKTVTATAAASSTHEAGFLNRQTSPPPADSESRGTVLIADDNADMREYIARLLAGRYQVETAANGDEALALALRHPPDLVLSDVMMPGLDGFALVHALRARPETSALPVILLSARAGEESRVEGFEGGASDYLVKPFTSRELLARVGAHLEMARLRKQSALREAELRAQTEAVLESITDGFATFDSDWRFIYVNDEAVRLSGKTREEMLGRIRWEVFPSTAGTILESEFGRAVRDRVQVEFEFFSPPRHGWFAIKGYPTRDGGLSIYFREITAQKEAEQALRTQETLRETDRRRWRELFFQVPAAVAILHGPNHIYGHVNSDYQRLVGRSAERLLGKGVREAFPEIEIQGFLNLLDGVYRSGRPHIAKEARIQFDLNGDGDLRDLYLNFAYLPTHDDAGRIDGIFVHAVDVTGLVTARKRIEETNERIKLALTATRAMVWEWDPKTGRVTREQGLEELIGWSKEEVPDTFDWFREQLHPEDAERVRGELQSLAAAGPTRVLLYRIRHRDGGWRWVEDHAVVHLTETGEISRVIGIAIDRTARERAQEELRHSQERFQTAIRAVSDLIWTNNSTGEMQGEQPGWCAFTGQSTEECQGYGWAGAVHPEDAQPTIEAWREAVAECKMFVFEHRVRRHDGVYRHFSIRALPLLDAAGNIREWVGVHTDITARRQAEEALRQSEARFRELAESMPQVVWTLTPDFVCNYVNARWTELTGYDLAATAAGEYRRGMPPEDADALTRTSSAGLKAGQPFTYECRFRRISDGSLRWYLVRCVPVHNARGEIIQWLGTSTDIDEQKRAAEALRFSEWRLRFTFEAASFGSWELNPRTLHGTCSARCNAIFGYGDPGPDWTHERFLQHVVAEDLERVQRIFQESPYPSGELNFECRIRRASDGAVRWIWICGRMVSNVAGAPDLILGLTGDITERKEAEAALAQANDELTRANADLEQFGYSASHDLQEPLRNVMIYSQLLVRNYSGNLDERGLEMLGHLRSGAARMERLIRDLLAYTQVKKLDVPEDADAMQAVSDAMANLANAIAESGAKVECGTLPSVTIHKVHLQQIFQNLIGNALKYRSERPPLIQVAAEQRDRHWLFSVRDNGIGIAPEYLEQIFGLFKRLHNADGYAGTGIGLAICKRTVEGYGGRIWADSRLGEGSTFYFTLPF